MALEFSSISVVSAGDYGIISFTPTQATFSVPVSVTFDVFINDTYYISSSQPDGVYEISSAVAEAIGGGATSFQIFFDSPNSGIFNVVMVENNSSGSYITTSNIDSYIEQWWETEVKPELEAINTTLQNILEQLTPVVTEAQGNVLADQFAKMRAQLTPVTAESQNEVLADQIARLRYLADPNATETGNDNNNGSGIRVANPYVLLREALSWYTLFESGSTLFDEIQTLSPEELQQNLNLLNSWAEKVKSNLDNLK